MSNNYDIRISYLKFLKREPSTEEIEYAITNNLSDTDLDILIYNSIEYSTLHNITHFDFTFDNNSNIYSVSNIINNNSKNGVTLTNGFVGITTTTTYNECINPFFKENLKSTDAFDFTNVTFTSNNNNFNDFNITNHTQSLDLNKCKFTDVFDMKDGNIHVIVEKYPLQNNKYCFLQKFTLLSSSESYENLQINHNFHQEKDFSTFMLSDNNHMSSINNNFNTLTNLYVFPDSETISKGYNIYDKIIQYKFDFELIANTEYTFYILSCLSPINNSTFVKHSDLLINLFNSSPLILISDHISKWSVKWNKSIDIINKDSIPINYRDNLDKLNFTIKYALFNIYSDMYSNDYIFQLPILILLNPNLAKKVLNDLILYDNINIQLSNGYQIYKIALLSINIWNLFRTSKDKGWLQTSGFPMMTKNAEILIEFIDKDNYNINNIVTINDINQNNNVLTNYLVKQALTFTNQAIYELNFNHIEIYKTLADSINLIYFNEDNTLTQVNDTNITIKLGSNDGLYHFDFFDSEDTLIGYRFGGDSGRKFALTPDTEYTFFIDNSLDSRSFLLTDIYNSNFILSNNTYSNNSSNLKGYRLYTDDSMFATFRDNFNHTLGENAFISQSISSNVIEPFHPYNFETLNYAEPYLLFNSYYNNSFEQPKSQLIDIIKDNVLFFTNNSSNNSFNEILESGLNGLVSQYDSKYVNRRSYMNICYYKLLNVMSKNKDIWTNSKDAVTILFVILSCLFELTPQGAITSTRFQIKEYGLQYNTRNVLPDPWRRISLNNIGLNNQSFVINNALYIDTPFNNIIDAISYKSILNELDNSLTIFADLNNVFPSGYPDNLDYKLLLQEIDTDSNNSNNDSNNYNMATVSNHPDAITNSNYINIPFDPLQSDSSQNEIITPFIDRTVYFYFNNDGVEKMLQTNFELLEDISSTNLINPTIHSTISFEAPTNTLIVDMSFNSLDVSQYGLFSNLDINIYYSSTCISSNVIYENTNTHTYTSNNYIDLSQINISIDNFVPIASANYPVGKLYFQLKPEILENISNINFPLDGTVSSFKQKEMYFTNKDIFPPTVYQLQTEYDFIYPSFSLSNSSSDIYYYPITTVSSCELDTFTPFETINTFLTALDNNVSLTTINNGIFITKDNNNNDNIFYGLGSNNFNRLMLTSTGVTDVTIPTEISTLSDYLTDNTIIIKSIVSSSFNTMILDTLGEVHCIGYNESYNLGTGDNINKTEIVKSTELNLLPSPIKQIVLNEKMTLVLLENNEIYGMGESDLFYFLIDSDDTSITQLDNPTLLPRINDFISTNNYTIDRIETGFNHFKFLLINNNISDILQKEWWGIGLNMYTNMGINSYIDTGFVVKYMNRLHLIESFIQGYEYYNYTGLKTTNPSKYHLISPNGVPSLFTAIIDIITKEIYIIGSMDNGITIYNEWTRLTIKDDLEDINPQFYSLYENGIIVGGSIDNTLYLL